MYFMCTLLSRISNCALFNHVINLTAAEMFNKRGVGVNAFTIGKRKADELLARPSGMPPSKRPVETPPERYTHVTCKIDCMS